MVKQKYLIFKILDSLTENGLRQMYDAHSTVTDQTPPSDIMN